MKNLKELIEECGQYFVSLQLTEWTKNKTRWDATGLVRGKGKTHYRLNYASGTPEEAVSKLLKALKDKGQV